MDRRIAVRLRSTVLTLMIVASCVSCTSETAVTGAPVAADMDVPHEPAVDVTSRGSIPAGQRGATVEIGATPRTPADSLEHSWQILQSESPTATERIEGAEACFADGRSSARIPRAVFAGTWFADHADLALGDDVTSTELCVVATAQPDIRVACDPASSLGALLYLDQNLRVEQESLRLDIYHQESASEVLLASTTWVPWCGGLQNDERTDWELDAGVHAVPARIDVDELEWMIAWGEMYFDAALASDLLHPAACDALAAAVLARTAVEIEGRQVFESTQFGFSGARTPTVPELERLNELIRASHRANLHVERALDLEPVNVTGMNNSFDQILLPSEADLRENGRLASAVVGAWLTSEHWEIASGADVARRLADIRDRRCASTEELTAFTEHPALQPFDASTADRAVICDHLEATYEDRNEARASLLSGDTDAFAVAMTSAGERYRALDRWFFLEPHFRRNDMGHITLVEQMLGDLLLMPEMGREYSTSVAEDAENNRQIIDDFTTERCPTIPEEVIEIESVASAAPKIGE